MVLTVGDAVEVLERAYDPRWAESWDAVGLVTGDLDQPLRRVLLAVDPAPAVVDEAVAWSADLLVTHHPLLLRGVHGVATTTPKGRAVTALAAGSRCTSRTPTPTWPTPGVWTPWPRCSAWSTPGRCAGQHRRRRTSW